MRYLHSSSSKNRESILKIGLLNSLSPNHSLSYSGVFFDTSFENIDEFHNYMGEDTDIWELINPGNYQFQEDINWFKGVYTNSNISSNDLKLVKIPK